MVADSPEFGLSGFEGHPLCASMSVLGSWDAKDCVVVNGLQSVTYPIPLVGRVLMMLGYCTNCPPCGRLCNKRVWPMMEEVVELASSSKGGSDEPWCWVHGDGA